MEHGALHDELPGPLRVRGRGHQRLLALALRIRFFRLHQFLVVDGVPLDEINRDAAALAVVLLKQGDMILPLPGDADQLVRQVERVMQAAVHAHAAQGIVDMGCVPGQRHAVPEIGFRYALVHPVQGAVPDPVIFISPVETLQAFLYMRIAEQFVIAVLRCGREQYAPYLVRAQDDAPLFGVRDIVDPGQVVEHVFKRKIGTDDQELLVVGKAAIIDPCGFSHLAAGPVTAGQETRPDGLRAAGRFNTDAHAVIILVEPAHPRIEPVIHAGITRQPVGDNAGQFVLLQLQTVRVGGFIRDQLHAELGDFSGHAIAVLVAVNLQPPGQHLLDHAVAQAGDHFQRGRVKRGGPQVNGRGGSLFQQGHRDIALRQRQGEDRPGRSGAGDDHLGFAFRVFQTHCRSRSARPPRRGKRECVLTLALS